MGEEGELFDCKQSAINEFLNINIEDIMEFCKRHFVLLSSVALTGNCALVQFVSPSIRTYVVSTQIGHNIMLAVSQPVL